MIKSMEGEDFIQDSAMEDERDESAVSPPHGILELIPLGFFTLDSQSRFTYVNQAGRRIFDRLGANGEEIIGHPASRVFTGGLGSSFYEHHQKAIMTGETVEFEEQYPALGVWLEAHAYPSLDGISVFFQDVTDRKRLAEALCESEIRFRALAESAADGIITIDDEAKILFANGSAENIFGYKADELIGKALTELMPESYRSRFQNTFSQYLYSGMKHSKWERVEFAGLHKNGEIVPLEISYSESLLGGKPVFNSIIRDVRERKKAEELLKKSESGFRGVFQQSPAPMWIIDAESMAFTEVNQAACDFYGYSREEFSTMRLTDIRPQEDVPRLMEAFAAVRNQQPAMKRFGEWTHILKNGTRVLMEVAAQPCEFNRRKVIVCVMKDITRRKSKEKELRGREAKYRLLFEANPLPMFIVDPATFEILDVNKAAVAQYGYSEEEFRAMSVWNIRPEEEVPKLKRHLQSISPLTPGKIDSGRWRHRKKDGTVFEVEVLAESMEIDGVKTRLSIARPIPAENKGSFPLCFEACADPALIFDLDTFRILAANDAAVSCFGYDREELLAMKVWEIRPEQENSHFKSHLQSVADGQHSVHEDEKDFIKRKDGSTLAVEIKAESLCLDGKKARLVVARPASGKKNLAS